MNTPSFEERFGLPKKGLQINAIDKKTRIRIYNELKLFLWPRLIPGNEYSMLPSNGIISQYVYTIWSDHLGWNIDQKPKSRTELMSRFSAYILNDKLPWIQYLEFIEKAQANYLDILEDLNSDLINDPIFKDYINRVNRIFIEESCGYRFVGRYLTPVIDEVELNEIADALINTDSITLVRNHIKNALMLLSDRERPDYNNSVKESISALEALSRLIVNKPSAVMSQALDEVEKKIKIHPLLKLGLKSLYNWSSDASGVRHANKSSGAENFDSAKLTLVLCSGLVNYLIAKSDEAGITLES